MDLKGHSFLHLWETIFKQITWLKINKEFMICVVKIKFLTFIVKE